jgi:exopolyphosphatase/guanosine-5'-triphosphate,3'-diphosphate pyrophosphatase
VDVACGLHAVTLQEKTERVAVVATSAVRDAANGNALAIAVSKAIGEPVRVLSGEEEARTCFRAFRQRLDLDDRTVIGIDLGGGSLDLALGSGGGVQCAATLPAGVLRLHEELVHRDPLSTRDVGRLRKRVRELLAPHKQLFRNGGATEGIVAGGTVRALARLVVEKRAAHSGDKLNGVVLSMAVLRDLADQLTHATAAERLRLRGIRRRRADVLPAGAVILQTLADELRLETLRVCDWGLREGVILDLLDR